MIGELSKETTFEAMHDLYDKSTRIPGNFADGWWYLMENNGYYYIWDPPSQDNEGNGSVIVVFTIDDANIVERNYNVVLPKELYEYHSKKKEHSHDIIRSRNSRDSKEGDTSRD